MAPKPPLMDGEIVGIQPDHQLIFWNDQSKVKYVSGEKLEDWDDEEITPRERAAIEADIERYEREGDNAQPTPVAVPNAGKVDVVTNASSEELGYARMVELLSVVKRIMMAKASKSPELRALYVNWLKATKELFAKLAE